MLSLTLAVAPSLTRPPPPSPLPRSPAHSTKMARFNEETPDDPDVKYVSYGAEFTPSWSNAFRIPWGIVSEREGASRARSVLLFLGGASLGRRCLLSRRRWPWQ